VDNLYFTLASLPTLDPAASAPFASMAAFWDYVDHVPEEWKREFASGQPSEPSVKSFRDWDLSLRSALARVRLESLPWKEQESGIPSEGGEWMAQALEALDQPTPLDAENYLDDLRWSFLEDLGQGHQFDQTAFFVYVLKLELLQRRSALVQPRGLEVFDGLHAEVLAKTDLNIPTGEKS